MLTSACTRASPLTLEKKAENLDPFIQSVSVCGRWHHNNEEGDFRIIHGWLWGHTEIYVQWVADPVWYPKKGLQERGVPLVVKTATFPEFNHYESATNLDNVKCVEQNGKWVITADADNGYEEEPGKAKYQLVIYLSNQPGKFKLEKEAKSNKSSERGKP